MDSWSYLGLGTNTVLPKAGIKNVENTFWGEKIKGSVFISYDSELSSNKSRNRKSRPGVAYAVATSKNAKEALVS